MLFVMNDETRDPCQLYIYGTAWHGPDLHGMGQICDVDASSYERPVARSFVARGESMDKRLSVGRAISIPHILKTL